MSMTQCKVFSMAQWRGHRADRLAGIASEVM